MNVLLEKEDLRWKQRAKRNWYKHGDRNTKYFHACANQRRKRNCIKEVEDENCRMVKGHKEVEAVFRNYFETLFQSSQPGVEEIDKCLLGMSGRVTNEMNDRLKKKFTEMEVTEAVKQMAPLKAPGPDGFGPCFYQNHWGIVSSEVCRAALEVLNGNSIDPNLNYTNIVLIPKTNSPRKVTEYRPISLCNVMYKIVSKAISNRFKHVLAEIISPTQSAFLPGRLINDNIMVAYELLHSMRKRKKGKVGSMALKLDMSKAYDRVEWGFLEAVIAGKEVLIKAVLQAIPTYTMGVFKLPNRLCKDINVMLSKFWWGKQKEGKGIVWRKWEGLSVQKRYGGMGFRDIESFNTALLAKQGWRLIKYPSSLAAVMYREKYFKNRSFLEAKLGAQPSLVWRSIWYARNLLKEGLRWRVGDGKDIKIWGSKWLPKPISYAIQSPENQMMKDSKVDELINTQEGEWDEVKIRSLFIEDEAELILSIPLSRGNMKDKLIWGPSKRGVFSVRSAYFLDLEIKERNKGEGSIEKKTDER
ncbi:uncharacterized protein LOC122306380 [Carya illinoinensis]|uniref:uncharacterized protein LOC122306380 n=1 Tax=Carya illinoinensis TaxID=32201 RepID=UPI001C71C39A|nr:uncharacterized protein LOC122306380 [Carya illinoinensis]